MYHSPCWSKHFNPQLHQAAYVGDKDLVETLLMRGFNPHSEDEDGNTPLHYAAVRGNKNQDVILLLLKAGAKIGTKNSRGMTPLEIAQEKKASEIVKLMLEAEAYDERKRQKKSNPAQKPKLIKKTEK